MRTTLLAGTFALLAGVAGAQTTVTINPDRDGTLYESATGALANGAGGGIFSGATQGGQPRRALLRFDVAGSVPSGAMITSATLTIRVNMSPPGSSSTPHSVHLISQDWGEGTTVASAPGGSGGPSTPGSATWIHTFFSGSNWTNAGGDFAAAASATTALGGPGFYSLSSATLTSEVQAMLDSPAGNFGWLLKSDTENPATARRIISREAGNVANRPALEIEYTMGGIGSDYCGPAVNNSSGGPAVLAASGSATASDNDLNLSATGVPVNQFGYLVASQTQGFIMTPGTSQGNLCLGGNIGRFLNLVQSSGAAGTLNFDVDTTMVPQPSGTVAIMGGETWNFQAWFRDANPTSTSNFTQGVSIVFN